MRWASIFVFIATMILPWRIYAMRVKSHLGFRLFSRARDGSSSWEGAASGMTLVIVESPAKAKTIQKFLDPSRYLVDYSAGHVRDLPTSAKDIPARFKKILVSDTLKLYAGHLGVDVSNGFDPIYVPLPGKGEILKRLSEQAAACSRILLASDEDREGEAIAWHLTEVLQPKVPFKRAVFHEITKDAILLSFANPRCVDYQYTMLYILQLYLIGIST